MSATFFKDLELPNPDFFLGLGGGSHAQQTGQMLIELEKLLLSEKPAAIIVFGDTNTTLAGALAAAKIGVKIVHIEAGLRSFNRSMPEEINRIVTDHLSDLLFAPTEQAVKNLRNENLGGNTHITGDIMVDTLNYALKKNRELVNNQQYDDYYLATFHRPYNVDDPQKLKTIVNVLSSLDRKVIFPIHPRTNKLLKQNEIVPGYNLKIINPVGYFEFITLMRNCRKILTDSGGIQKEAYILEKPCLTFRPETEWKETVESGWNKLVDYNSEDVIDEIVNFRAPVDRPNLFGMNVSEKMYEILKEKI